jgi:hypothetical protein
LYTTQQLQGAHKYSVSCKIGNWQEDMELEEMKINNYAARKADDNLASTKMQSDFQRALKKVPQTFSADGLLRFGDKIMLSNKQTDSCFVVNISEKVSTTEDAYACTASPNITGPNARSIFIIERADKNDGYTDNIIHFG